MIEQVKQAIFEAAKEDKALSLTDSDVHHLSTLLSKGRFKAPVCVECNIAYRVKLNGVYVIDMFASPPQPYRIWAADMWECPSCQHRIMKGFSTEWVEHYQSEFTELLERIESNGSVIVRNFEKVQDAKAYTGSL